MNLKNSSHSTCIFLPNEIFLFLKAALERAQKKILQNHVGIVRFDQYLAMKTTKILLFKHVFSRKMINAVDKM